MIRRTEHGASFSVATIMLAPVLLLCVGLTTDGGRKTEAARTATSSAQSAARAATNAKATSAIAGQDDTAAAYQAANQYLAAAGVTGTVTIEGNTITIKTTKTTDTVFLGLIGINQLTAHGEATASLEEVRP